MELTVFFPLICHENVIWFLPKSMCLRWHTPIQTPAAWTISVTASTARSSIVWKISGVENPLDTGSLSGQVLDSDWATHKRRFFISWRCSVMVLAQCFCSLSCCVNPANLQLMGSYPDIIMYDITKLETGPSPDYDALATILHHRGAVLMLVTWVLFAPYVQ